VFAYCQQPVPNDACLLQSFCHAVPGAWCVFGCMLSAGGSLQWLRDTLWPEAVSALRRRGKDPGELYPQIIAEAEVAPPGCEALVFLPYLTGERCPYPDPQARGAFVGLTARHTRGHLVRAVLEGISFGLRDQVQLMRSAGIDVRQVRAGGGGARSEFWRAMLADMFDCPVATINTNEGAAYGAALLAGVGIGNWSSVPEACEQSIQVRHVAQPTRVTAKLYAEQHAIFTQLYRDLREANCTLGSMDQTQP